MNKHVVKSILLILFGLTIYSNNLSSQIVTDSPSYFDATIHFPIEFNAKVETRTASYSFVEKIYTTHMSDMSLKITMYLERKFDDDMLLYLSKEYVDIVSGLSEKGNNIAYKTFNNGKKFFVVSWTENETNYYLKCHLHGYAIYLWILSWDKTNSDTHRRAKTYLDNNQIYFTWQSN